MATPWWFATVLAVGALVGSAGDIHAQRPRGGGPGCPPGQQGGGPGQQASSLSAYGQSSASGYTNAATSALYLQYAAQMTQAQEQLQMQLQVIQKQTAQLQAAQKQIAQLQAQLQAAKLNAVQKQGN